MAENRTEKQANEVNTVVINMFGGPSAGKTGCAWLIAGELKKRGYVVEYVPEVAKEKVWDHDYAALDGSLERQSVLLAEQEHRIARLKGQVDFIVTDSPLMIIPIYLKTESPEIRKYFTDRCYQRFSEYVNFSVFINRGDKFEQAGRIHNLGESKQKDQEIKDLLGEYGIFYGTYFHNTLPVIVDNCTKTFRRVNPGRAVGQQMIGEDGVEKYARAHAGDKAREARDTQLGDVEK